MRYCDVAVIGAGPVGLTLLTALRRYGIDAIGLERGSGPTHYPKSRLLSGHSMEIFRGLDLARAVRAAGLDSDWCQRLIVRRSLTGPQLARIERPPPAGPPAAGLSAATGSAATGSGASWPAETPALCTQDALEHVLVANLDRNYPGTVHWEREAVALEPDELGVTVRTVHTGSDGSGAEQAWRAAYVLCADGIRGLSATLPGAGTRRVFTRQVSIRASVALGPWVRAAPAFITYLVDRGLSAQLLVVDGKDDWIIASMARRGETVSDYGPERARSLLAAAFGLDGSHPVVRGADLTDLRLWDLATRVSDAFRLGRVVRAGDAAHEILPTGAMGLNLGLADAAALVPRLRAILAGEAGSAVLDVYADERRAAALRTAQWSRANLNAVALMLGAAARREDEALAAAATAVAPYLDTDGLEVGGRE